MGVSYLRAADASTDDEEWKEQLDALVRLATDIGALGVRLFPGARQSGPLAVGYRGWLPGVGEALVL
ncbi:MULTISPECIES: hypothetical protein [unclassified Streptomyces]|uniref:hypothetical protein n=1 Tax=unclassified Streptomyces TaxID=2593676 RepID=UPI00093D551A|nr:hypothetical protein [Streptomyces sp. CB02058]OKI88714.1 hypothetical protein AMK10_30800 [Streptomyces sp. CB02058]